MHLLYLVVPGMAGAADGGATVTVVTAGVVAGLPGGALTMSIESVGQGGSFKALEL